MPVPPSHCLGAYLEEARNLGHGLHRSAGSRIRHLEFSTASLATGRNPVIPAVLPGSLLFNRQARGSTG